MVYIYIHNRTLKLFLHWADKWRGISGTASEREASFLAHPFARCFSGTASWREAPFLRMLPSRHTRLTLLQRREAEFLGGKRPTAHVGNNTEQFWR